MAVNRLYIAMIALLVFVQAYDRLIAQPQQGEVLGYLSAGVNKLEGDYTDDLYGPAGNLSLTYAPIPQLAIEARVGLGRARWIIPEAALAQHPEYFGQSATYGDYYPGSLVPIERENEVRLTTYDLLLQYVLVDDIRAVPFIYAGVSLLNFTPSTAELHEALPNFSTEVYSGTTFSLPLGAGVRIPFSDRVGLILRGEYRFAFTEYLDDVNWNSKSDGVTAISVGLTYRFDSPARPEVASRYGQDEETVIVRRSEKRTTSEDQRTDTLLVMRQDSVFQSPPLAVLGSTPPPQKLDTTLFKSVSPNVTDTSSIESVDISADEPLMAEQDATAALPPPNHPECVLLTRTGSQKIKWEAGETIQDYNDRSVRIRQTLSDTLPVTYMTPVNPDGTYGKAGARIVKVQGYDLKNCEECFDLLFD